MMHIIEMSPKDPPLEMHEDFGSQRNLNESYTQGALCDQNHEVVSNDDEEIPLWFFGWHLHLRDVQPFFSYDNIDAWWDVSDAVLDTMPSKIMFDDEDARSKANAAYLRRTRF